LAAWEGNLCPALSQGCGGFEQLAIGLGIGALYMAGIARRLNRPRCRHTRCDIGRRFSRRWQRQIGGTDSGNLDMQIDAVEQSPPKARLIIDGALGRA
jgi:hypothetical protein